MFKVHYDGKNATFNGRKLKFSTKDNSYALPDNATNKKWLSYYKLSETGTYDLAEALAEEEQKLLQQYYDEVYVGDMTHIEAYIELLEKNKPKKTTGKNTVSDRLKEYLTKKGVK